MEFIKQLLSGDQTRRSPRDSTSSLFKKCNGKGSKLCKFFSDLRSEPQDEGLESPSKLLESISNKFNDCAWGSRYQLDKKTLIFDLDNTLIYASKDIPDADKYTHISFEKEGEYFVRYIVKRPGLLKFLKKLSKVFNICIFTSAEETYAKKIIEATKISKYIYTLYDRTHCKKVGEFLYVKNIWDLGFQKDQAVLIDDLDMQMECQPENGINIKAFEGEECDRELYKLYPFLQRMSENADVRPAQKNFDEHMKGDFMMKKEDCEYSDGSEIDFDEGCVRTSVKGSCCPISMLNRSSSTNLCLLETSLSSTSSKSQTDSEN